LFLLVVAQAPACTTTLEPSIVVGDGGSPLATCSRFSASLGDYLICTEALDFEAAAADCAQRGSLLSGIGSAEENAFIAASADGVLNGDSWLGGTRDDEYVWRWPDGTVFWRGGRDGAAEDGAFVRWLPGEPNNSSTVTTEPERCLALLDDSNWNDRACSLTLPYVCELIAEGP
jgi:hypothetical protein